MRNKPLTKIRRRNSRRAFDYFIWKTEVSRRVCARREAQMVSALCDTPNRPPTFSLYTAVRDAPYKCGSAGHSVRESGRCPQGGGQLHAQPDTVQRPEPRAMPDRVTPQASSPSSADVVLFRQVLGFYLGKNPSPSLVTNLLLLSPWVAAARLSGTWGLHSEPGQARAVGSISAHSTSLALYRMLVYR